MAKRISLICHPDTPARQVDRVEVRFGMSSLEYRVFAAGGLAVPPAGQPRRRDELWTTTCFELFTHPEPETETAYQECNFSPSRSWAAYEFRTYRRGRRDLEIAPPRIDFWSDVTGCALRVEHELVWPFAFHCRVGLSAIVEEADGTKSYWALAHPPGEPDFHHPDCFAVELPPLV
jgi:hypothetical protein